MGITAVASNAIVDSTATGRDLITAANAAAGRAVLEIEDGSYNWTADHVFEGTIAASTYDFITAVDGKVNHPDLAGNFYVSFNDANVFRFTNLDFIPMSTGTKNLGRSDLRFADVFSVDGSFSGNLIVGSNAPTAGGWESEIHNRLLFQSLSSRAFTARNPNTLSDVFNINTSQSIVTVNDDLIVGNSLINETGGSYKLYNLGTEGDTDTEYLETSFVFDKPTIQTLATGTGVARDLTVGTRTGARLEVRPVSGQSFLYDGSGSNIIGVTSSGISLTGGTVYPAADDTTDLGTASLRWANVNSVDGDFSGTLSAVTVAGQTNNLTLQSNSGASLISLAESGTASITAFSSIYQQFTSTGVGYRQNCYPIFSTLDMGSAATPWNNGYFNNLSSAVGGSYKLYNLGAEGDADTEYCELEWDANIFKIFNKVTGTGTGRTLRLGSGSSYINVNYNGTWQFYRAGNLYMSFGSANITTYKYFQPSADLNTQFGSGSRRWAWGNFGGLYTNCETITASTDSMGNSDHTFLCDCTSNAITINLQSASGKLGQQYVIKKIDSTSNAVTIDPNGSETIDGGLTATLTTQYESITLVSDGTNWFKV